MPEIKSSFAVTCNLLSQYIKENGTLAARGVRPPTTMSLLPGVGLSGEGGTETKNDTLGRNVTRSMDLFPQRAGFGPSAPAADLSLPEKMAQLTIFYGGKVMVFDQFPAEKARDLMQMATKSGSNGQKSLYTPAMAAAGTSPPASMKPPASQPSISYLPMARKQSLHRFLEKRKDRIQAKAPYQANDYAAKIKKEQEETQSWLGLGPQISKPECSR